MGGKDIEETEMNYDSVTFGSRRTIRAGIIVKIFTCLSEQQFH